MSSKKKLIVSMLVLAFVLLSIIATVAIAFALTQQTIKTTLNITYQAEDLDGTASATFTVGGVTESLTAEKNGQVIGDKLVFKASDTESAGNLMFPEDGLALTSENDNVVIQYTYSNTGSKHYIASMDFDANIEKENMKVEYSINGTDYSEQRYAVVVPAKTSNKNYWIKISIIDKAENASFIGDFNWVLNGCDPQDKAYLTLPSLEIQATETAGAYQVSVVNSGEYAGNLVIPAEVGEDMVTAIVEGSLTDEQKNMVRSVSIPETVTTIGESAFEGFTNLETVALAQNQSVSGASAQSATGLTTIGANAFKNCSSLDEFIIPNTLEDLANDAFAGCSLLKKITIDNNNEDIMYTLWLNLSFETLIFGDSVTTIADEMFSFANIKNLEIGRNVQEIGWFALIGSPTLETVKVKEGNTHFYDKGNCLISSDGVVILAGQEFEIPNDGTITAIGDYAFYNNSNIISIVIPDSVKSIGEGAFNTETECNLESVKLGSNLETIYTGAFACSKITEIILPASLTTIYEAAFIDCVNLTYIEVNSNFTLDEAVFDGCPIETIKFNITPEDTSWAENLCENVILP